MDTCAVRKGKEDPTLLLTGKKEADAKEQVVPEIF
jgi:hypothetical protein